LPDQKGEDYDASSTAREDRRSAPASGGGIGREAISMQTGECRVFERWTDFLTRRARRLIPPAIAPNLGASDLVQETFVDAVRKKGEMPASGRSDEIRAWLYRIMAWNLKEKKRQFLGTEKADVRRVVRMERESGKLGPGEGLVDGGESPSGEAARKEEVGRLAEAIARLPEPDRKVVVWRYWERREYAEIGQLIGKSPDAARMIHARACKKLAKFLGEEAN
jgi:RNA polymerase sigma-70 factor (ECF subfamily)